MVFFKVFLMILWGVWAFNCLGQPLWPINDANSISDLYGPRNTSGDSWFHPGIDIGNTSQGAYVHAPFKVRRIATNGLRSIYENLDYSVAGPKYIMFEHLLRTPNEFGEFAKGAIIGTVDYITSPHVHFVTWRENRFSLDGGYASYNLTGSNPLEWWPHSTPQNSITCTDLISPSTDINGKRYFQFKVTELRTDFVLNKITVTLTDDIANTTAYFLENSSGATVDFNDGISVWKKNADFEVQNLDYNGTTYSSKTRNGVCIFTPTFTRATSKDYYFRYFLAAGKPDPKYISIRGYNFNNDEVFRSDGNTFSVGIEDNIIITAGPSSITNPPQNIAYSCLFSDRPPLTHADYWTWSLSFYTSGTPFIATSTTNLAGLMGSTWNVSGFTLPSNGYQWIYDENGHIMGKVTVETIDSDNVRHVASMPVTYCVSNPFPMDILYQDKTIISVQPDVKAHNSITMQFDNFSTNANISFKAGKIINVGDGITIQNGGIVNLTIDPTLKY